MQGAKPLARTMTQTPKENKTKKEKDRRSKKFVLRSCSSTAGRSSDREKRSNQETNTFPDCFYFFFRSNMPSHRESAFTHRSGTGEPLARVPHAERFPRNLSAPFLSFGKAREFRPLRRSSQGVAPTPHSLLKKAGENFMRLRRTFWLAMWINILWNTWSNWEPLL